MTDAEYDLLVLLVRLALAQDVLWLPAILIALKNAGIAVPLENVA